MVRLNFFGDFKCNDVSRLHIDTSLKYILESGDVNALNFEAPIRELDSLPIEKSGPNIENDKRSPQFLCDAGFNLFSLANNHVYDYGEESLKKTMASFSNGHVIGAGSWAEAYNPAIMEIGGFRIAFMALTHHEFGVLYEESYHEQALGAAWMLHPIVDELIVETKQKSDFLFILNHCGMEHEYYPMPEIRTLYHHWINMGADGIFASHPHTPQPWEYYKRKPVVYSLGNFCFDALSPYPPKFWYWSIVSSVLINGKDIILDNSYCKYDETSGKLAIVSDDSEFNDHIEKIMGVFSDKRRYLESVSTQCAKYERMYIRFFNIAGYYKLKFKIVAKQVIKRILGKSKQTSLLPLINDFRCETHRWTITRILEQKVFK